MAIRPVKFLIVNFALGSATATIPSGAWAGYPYQWNATLTVTAQPHGSDETTPQFFYDGTSVKVGDCIATQGQGRFLTIVSITSQDTGTVNCVVEDVNYENVYQDATQAGDGAISDGEGYLFEIVDGIPVLHPLPDALAGSIPSYFASNVMTRFFGRESQIEIEVGQASHGFSVGNPIYVTASGAYAKAYIGTAESVRIVGLVTNVDYGPDKFRFRPLGQRIRGITMPAGTPGSIVYLDSTPGELTTMPVQGSVPVLIKLDGTSAVVFGGGFGATYSSSSSSSFSSSSFSSSSSSFSSSSFSSSSSSFSSSSSSYSSSSSSSSYNTIMPGGASVVFENGAAYNVSVAVLDSTRAVVCYSDNDNSGYGTACVLSISGTTITTGTPTVFESANTSNVSVAMLDSTHAVVCYQDFDNAQQGTACVLSIPLSDTTITPGTPVVFESGRTYNTSVAALDSTRAVVCYMDFDNSLYGTACILSISGATITPRTPTVFESAHTIDTSVAMIDSTHAVVCYCDDGGENYGTACVLSISGTTITPGTPTVFESASTYRISVAMIDSTHAVVCYQDYGNSSKGTACVLSISGTTITPETPTVFESAYTYDISVAMFDSTHVVVCYRDNDNANYGTACILSISGTTITPGTPTVFESRATYNVSVAALDSKRAVVCYRDNGNLNYGTAVCLTLS